MHSSMNQRVSNDSGNGYSEQKQKYMESHSNEKRIGTMNISMCFSPVRTMSSTRVNIKILPRLCCIAVERIKMLDSSIFECLWLLIFFYYYYTREKGYIDWRFVLEKRMSRTARFSKAAFCAHSTHIYEHWTVGTCATSGLRYTTQLLINHSCLVNFICRSRFCWSLLPRISGIVPLHAVRKTNSFNIFCYVLHLSRT